MPLPRSWRIAITLFSVGALVLACNAILGNKDAAFVAESEAGCDGFLCGRHCAKVGDPSYGCQITNDCQACSVAHGTSTCVADSCALATCNPGYGDCSADAGGCETNLLTDAKHCGRCGVACGQAAPFCADGGCTNGCPPERQLCDAGCLDLLGDPNNCGTACDNAPPCPPPPLPNQFAVCEAGTCSFECNAPLTLCNGQCSDTQTDGQNCGQCGNVCTVGDCQDSGCCIPTGQTGCSVSTDCCDFNAMIPAECSGGFCCLGPLEPCAGSFLCCSGVCNGPTGECQ